MIRGFCLLILMCLLAQTSQATLSCDGVLPKRKRPKVIYKVDSAVTPVLIGSDLSEQNLLQMIDENPRDFAPSFVTQFMLVKDHLGRWFKIFATDKLTQHQNIERTIIRAEPFMDYKPHHPIAWTYVRNSEARGTKTRFHISYYAEQDAQNSSIKFSHIDFALEHRAEATLVDSLAGDPQAQLSLGITPTGRIIAIWTSSATSKNGAPFVLKVQYPSDRFARDVLQEYVRQRGERNIEFKLMQGHLAGYKLKADLEVLLAKQLRDPSLTTRELHDIVEHPRSIIQEVERGSTTHRLLTLHRPNQPVRRLEVRLDEETKTAKMISFY